MDATARAPSRRGDAPAHVRAAVSIVVGLCAGGACLASGEGRLAPLVGWDVAGLVYVCWIWLTVRPLDAAATARRAQRNDPRRLVTHVLLLSASVVSLVAVVFLLLKAGSTHGTTKHLLIGLGMASVVVAWTVVHTVFALHYAHLYYQDSPGGVDFNEDDAPAYMDFAYLSFTIGMTFQVSDTDLKTKPIRHAALRQALLSYLFGAVIIATTINLVAGLTASK